MKIISSYNASSDSKPRIDFVGMDVIVRAGTLRLLGVDYVLPEDTEFTCTTPLSQHGSVSGHLVRSKENSSILVLINEQHPGDPSPDWRDPEFPFEIIGLLFLFDVPAGTTNLDSVDMTVFQVLDTSLLERTQP